jgi:hypothetical protein
VRRGREGCFAVLLTDEEESFAARRVAELRGVEGGPVDRVSELVQCVYPGIKDGSVACRLAVLNGPPRLNLTDVLDQKRADIEFFQPVENLPRTHPLLLAYWLPAPSGAEVRTLRARKEEIDVHVCIVDVAHFFLDQIVDYIRRMQLLDLAVVLVCVWKVYSVAFDRWSPVINRSMFQRISKLIACLNETLTETTCTTEEVYCDDLAVGIDRCVSTVIDMLGLIVGHGHLCAVPLGTPSAFSGVEKQAVAKP